MRRMLGICGSSAFEARLVEVDNTMLEIHHLCNDLVRINNSELQYASLCG